MNGSPFLDSSDSHPISGSFRSGGISMQRVQMMEVMLMRMECRFQGLPKFIACFEKIFALPLGLP